MSSLLIAVAATALFSSPAECFPASDVIAQAKYMKDNGMDVGTAYNAIMETKPKLSQYLIQHQVVLAYDEEIKVLTPQELYTATMTYCLSSFPQKRYG